MRTTKALNQSQWYRNPAHIRQKTNHLWNRKEVQTIFTLRSRGFLINQIIEKMGLDVGKIQVYNVIRRLRKSLQNKCFQCGKPLSEKESVELKGKLFKHCSKCRKRNTAYKEVLRQKKIRIGVCVCCGEKKALENKTTCKKCLSPTYRERITKGICGICGKHPLDENSISMCPTCLRKNRNNSKNYRNELTLCK